MSLVYKNEKKLFNIILIFSLLFWLILIVGTAGFVLLWLLAGFVLYLFAQSALISHLKGNGVKVSSKQMTAIYNQYNQCCYTLEVEEKPDLYILNSEGFLNALATRFLRKHYVILYSGVIDALKKYPDGINFYIGHELGHIKRGHLNLSTILLPGNLLPIIGSAYSRAREYSCDLHGLMCCKTPKDAICAMAVLAMGPEQWNKLNVRAYAEQADVSGSFWMSFHELTADYPWLSKRMTHLIAKANNQEPDFPSRNVFAWILAVFVPRLGARTGFSAMIFIATIGILAAIALPAYQQYMKRDEVAVAESKENPLVSLYDLKTHSAMQENSTENVVNKLGQRSIGSERQMGQQNSQTAAVPQPVNHQAKMKAHKALRIASELELLISEYMVSNGVAPRDLRDVGVPEEISTSEISRIEMTNRGFILHLQGDANLDGKTMIFKADVDESGEVKWNCRGGTLDKNYRFDECV